jgi:rhodanese-related sulfurtransferase
VIARALRQLAGLLLLALVPAMVSGAIQFKWNGSPATGDEIPLSAVRALGKQVLWVDARPREKFEAEHVPGAVLLNDDEWDRLVPAFLDAWEPEKTVVVYCDSSSCDASHAVADRLRDELKLERVKVLKGGWDAWLQK